MNSKQEKLDEVLSDYEYDDYLGQITVVLFEILQELKKLRISK